MSAGKVQKIRKARRVELRCILGFASGEIEGDATVTNISTSGCRAESDVNMAEGLDVQLTSRLASRLNEPLYVGSQAALSV